MLNPIKTSDFDAIKLSLASPDDILSWSSGEVSRSETINYRTQRPEKDGLFCEKIFGPAKDWECACGKYKKIRFKGVVCDKCGVEVTRSIVRRERMGHIKLEVPCSHIWFLKGLSSKIGLILNIGVQSIEKVIYFSNFIVTEVDEDLKKETLEIVKKEFQGKKKGIESETKNKIEEIKKEKKEDQAERIDDINKEKEEGLEALNFEYTKVKKELKDLKPLLILSESKYQDLSLKFGHLFEAGIGGDAIKTLLKRINIKKTIKKLEESLETVIESKKERIIKRLKFLKNLDKNDIRPEWMILDLIPIIPPDLRPMVALDGGRFASSDLNDLYRRVINRNNRLKQLKELNAPEVICRNEKRMLQEAVDSLIDNSARNSKTVVASTGQKRQLKSLADSLKGKQGRFRQNLLGKRVDYSGRSVIVVNPKLNLDQCGLPKLMALEIFKPFVMSELIKKEIAHNVKSASRYIETGSDEVWGILEKIIDEAYVLLNRAPTLHRLGIQAFKPVLIEGKAIQIHPLICSAFNADFDGDQMAVHVPLTKEAKKEARDIMLSSHNILKPATGEPIVTPNQDIVWGAYYMTLNKEEGKKAEEFKYFSNSEEALLAFDHDLISIHELIKVKIENKLIETTSGRIIFNKIVPEKTSYVNKSLAKGDLKNLIQDCLNVQGEERTVKFIDDLKNLSLKYITKSGLSWSFGDLPELPEKDELISEANKKVEEIKEQFEEGLLTESERHSKTIEIWTLTKEKIFDISRDSLRKYLPVYSMIDSGARGSWAQPVQIVGMKGLVTSPSGAIIELPVKGNLKKGFSVLEYFIATHATRKGLADTALRTANAGYLTRRLVDVAQDVIISSDDCGDKEGVLINRAEVENNNNDFFKKITGRYLAKDLKDKSGKVLIKAGAIITEKNIEKIKNKDVESATIRSVLNCKLNKGICAKCYGLDLAYNKEVKLGAAAGIVAAQSIGEPGTQLTMRTFHTGGVASSEDITQGLPRVEEIFEKRIPKKKALMSEFQGKVKIELGEKTIKSKEGKDITVDNPQEKVLKIVYKAEDSDKYYFRELANEIKLSSKKTAKKGLEPKISLKDGDKIKKGETLYTIMDKSVESDSPGIVKIKDKFIEVFKEVNKTQEFILPKGVMLWVKDGDEVKPGDRLTDGSFDLRELYRLRGRLETQKYIIQEIQYVYSSQGQPLNDKHVEIIARQMFSRYLIKSSGDTDLLPGETLEGVFLEQANKGAKNKAKAERLLMGITKTSLSTDSFLSAASFQETSRVLIEAALSGKIDYLEGLKENVIIGRLIPAGTGYQGRKKREVYK
jgi:DNA-directed RNA polymerase subunit beta'